MATLAELKADLAACQAAISKAEAVQSYSVPGRSKQNALLETLYRERKELRAQIAKMSGPAINIGIPRRDY